MQDRSFEGAFCAVGCATGRTADALWTGQQEGSLAVWCSSVVLQKIGFAGPPDDPFHVPPIKRNVPATTDDTSQNESFHTPLPKGHGS
jgi:hypothetical protein